MMNIAFDSFDVAAQAKVVGRLQLWLGIFFPFQRLRRGGGGGGGGGGGVCRGGPDQKAIVYGVVVVNRE